MRPHRWQPTRLPRPWDSPGKNTGVSCHFPLQWMKVKSESEVTQSCPTLSDPMDCSLPDSSVHGIFQARVLEWGAIAVSIPHPRRMIILLPPPQFSQLSHSVMSNSLWTHEPRTGTPGLPVHHQLLESTQTHVHWQATPSTHTQTHEYSPLATTQSFPFINQSTWKRIPYLPSQFPA